jgi:hypothetical protein
LQRIEQQIRLATASHLEQRIPIAIMPIPIQHIGTRRLQRAHVFIAQRIAQVRLDIGLIQLVYLQTFGYVIERARFVYLIPAAADSSLIATAPIAAIQYDAVGVYSVFEQAVYSRVGALIQLNVLARLLKLIGVQGRRRAVQAGVYGIVQVLHFLAVDFGQISDLRLAEQLLPQLHVDQLVFGVQYLVVLVVVEIIDDLFVLVVEVRPYAERALVGVLVDALAYRVAQKRAEQTRVGVVAELEQVGLVELKCGRKLLGYLVDAVEPLEEHGAAFVYVVEVGRVAVALAEFVAVEEPVDFD